MHIKKLYVVIKLLMLLFLQVARLPACLVMTSKEIRIGTTIQQKSALNLFCPHAGTHTQSKAGDHPHTFSDADTVCEIYGFPGLAATSRD